MSSKSNTFSGLPGMLGLLLANPDCRRVTKYLGPNQTLKATYHGKRDRRNRSHHIVVTIGTPNYRERKFIAACKKAGEPFPIKKTHVHCPKKAGSR